MKKLVSLIVLISLGVVSFAQDYYQTIRNELEPIFANLDKSRVPTGYLGDYAVEEIDLSRFDGLSITDSNYVAMSDYDRILRTFESTKVNNLASFNADDIIDGIIASNDTLSVPISYIACKYNYIRHDAINIGAIECINGNLYDVFDAAGNWQNPYLEKKLFAFVPYVGRAKSSTVSFVFNGNIFTNLNITGIEFDCGDGAGYRTVFGTGQITANYSDSGHKELKLRISLSSGEQLLAHSDFIVEIPSNINYTPGFTIEPNRINDYREANEYDGNCVRARTFIHYSDNPLSKPLIVVEGYDPVDLIACFGSAKPKERAHGYSNFWKTCESFDDAVIANYDVIHIDFLDCNADIRANAKLLESIISDINQQKPAEADKNVIMGESMGGLIARYALCDMVRNHITHDCRMYISLDSPHLGANIPLGALYAAMDLVFSMNLLNPEICSRANKKLNLGLLNPENLGYRVKKCLRGTSVKQMLLNYVNESGVLDNSVHSAWQNELNGMGFPQGDLGSSITNIGISNGGTNILNPSDTLFHLDFFGRTKFLGEELLYFAMTHFKDEIPQNIRAKCRNSALTINTNILPFFSNSSLLYNIKIDYQKFFWWRKKDENIPLRNRTIYAPSTGFPMDLCNGSYFEIYEGSDYANYNISDSFNNLLVWGNYNYSVAQYFMFIPTASALCVGVANPLTGNEYLMSYSDLGSMMPSIPFNSVYLNSYNYPSEHINLGSSRDIQNYIKSCLSLEAIISGPKCAVQGSSYSAIGLENVSWSTSDSSVATISTSGTGSGTIHIVSPGFVTITATGTAAGSTVSISKRIMTGIPNYIISAENASLFETRYNLSATCSNPEINDFEDFINLSYDWGVKVGNGPITWYDNKSLTWMLTFVDENQQETVYFKAKCLQHTSAVSSIVLRPRQIIANPLLMVSGDGNVIGPEGSFEIIATKSAQGEQRKIKCILNDKYVLEFNYLPNSYDICKRAAADENFRALLMSVKPWGEKDFLIIKMLIIDEESGERQETALKLKYTDQL